MAEAKIPNDTLCEKLDPNKRYAVLRGFVGDAGSKELTRLYLSWTLQDYIDVPTTSVAHHAKVNSLGVGTATLLWIAAGTKLTLHRRSGNEKSESSFETDLLTGDISRAELGGASRGALLSSLTVEAGGDVGFTGGTEPCGYKTDYCTVTCAKECYAGGRDTTYDPVPLAELLTRLADVARLGRNR